MIEATDSTVADLMSRDVVTIVGDATLGDAAELMAGFGISGLPVVDDDGLLTGVVSETDLVRLRSGSPPWHSWHALLVRDLMTTPAIVIASTATVHEAACLMADLGIHRLFVVDAEGVPVGVVSESDVVAEIADLDE